MILNDQRQTPSAFRIHGIYGDATDRRVWINGTELTSTRSQKMHNKSPDGSTWGYAGSAPNQLALATLLEFTNDSEFSLLNHHTFKEMSF